MTTYLEERLEWYDHNYRIVNVLITDKQFDQLEKNLYYHPHLKRNLIINFYTDCYLKLDC